MPGLLIATAVLLYVNYELGIVFYLLNDLWHGVKQKTGIALILGAKPGVLHRVWTILPFITSGIVYVYIISPSVIPQEFVPYIAPVAFVGVLSFVCVALLKLWLSPSRVRAYVLAVTMLFLVNYGFILGGYIFFAIFAFRFVHDVSAFAFYVTHDQNRNRSTTPNMLYRYLSFISIPVPMLLTVPFFALLFAYFIRTVTNGLEIGFSILILIAMCHYYLESVMWKRDSLHRQHVSVK